MLEYKVTLRIFSKSCQLDELSTALGNPTKGYSIGDLFSRNRKKRELTFWSKESSTSDNFESHLNEILSFIDLKESEMTKLKETCEFDLFCMLSSNNGQGTTELTPKVMRKIADYDLNLILDVYLDEDDD